MRARKTMGGGGRGKTHEKRGGRGKGEKGEETRGGGHGKKETKEPQNTNGSNVETNRRQRKHK